MEYPEQINKLIMLAIALSEDDLTAIIDMAERLSK